jgi:hypothetical protein
MSLAASCSAGDQEPKCDDVLCTGKDGKCTKGDLKDCSCKSCPTGDKQPKCDDQKSCKGDKDNRCTLGKTKGCACAVSSCPEKRYMPYCVFCGTKGGDGKCKGIADNNNLWAGCECMDSAPVSESWPPVNQAIIDFDPSTLPDISPSSYTYGGGDLLKCQNLRWGAKQSDLKVSILAWCKLADGKKVTKTGASDVLYERFDYNGYSYWLGAQYDGNSGGKCGNSVEVKEINCVSTMLEELDDCNTGQPSFNGAELTDGCVKYHVTFSASTNEQDPPFKLLPQKDPECTKGSKDQTAIPDKFWLGVSKKFCKDVGDLQTRSIFGRSPPPTTKAYDDWKFHFEWVPAAGVCSNTCGEAMSRLALACEHKSLIPDPDYGLILCMPENILTLCQVPRSVSNSKACSRKAPLTSVAARTLILWTGRHRKILPGLPKAPTRCAFPRNKVPWASIARKPSAPLFHSSVARTSSRTSRSARSPNSL